MKDNTSKLLGLEDVIVKNIEEINDDIHISIELPRVSHIYPCCGINTNRIHDYRIQIVRDCSAFGKKVFLHLRKRRYRCSSCGKRFYENNSFLPRYHHVTQRLILKVISSFRETVSATHIAKESNISTTTALRYFDLLDYGKQRCSQ